MRQRDSPLVSFSLGGNQVAVVLRAASQNIVIEALLPVDVVDARLQLGHPRHEPLALLGEELLALGNGALPPPDTSAGTAASPRC